MHIAKTLFSNAKMFFLDILHAKDNFFFTVSIKNKAILKEKKILQIKENWENLLSFSYGPKYEYFT